MLTDSSKGKGPSSDKGGDPAEGVGQADQVSQVENREFDPLGHEQVKLQLPSQGYPATAISSAWNQPSPSLAPPTSAYPGAPPSHAPSSSGYPVTKASQAPLPINGYSTTTSAHAPPTNSFQPQATGYQATTSTILPPSTPSYPSC